MKKETHHVSYNMTGYLCMKCEEFRFLIMCHRLLGFSGHYLLNFNCTKNRKRNVQSQKNRMYFQLSTYRFVMEWRLKFEVLVRY